MNKITKEYLLISFVVVELLSMIFNFYFIDLNWNGKIYHFNFSVVFFCIGFFIVDIIADNFSPQEAKNFIFYKLFSQMLFLILGNVTVAIYGLENTQIAKIMSKSPWLMLSGIAATIVGYNITSSIMSKMKRGIYQGTSVFKRYLYSTLPGELAFSFVFSILCFNETNWISVFLPSAATKIILSIIFANLISLLIKINKVRAYKTSILQL